MRLVIAFLLVIALFATVFGQSSNPTARAPDFTLKGLSGQVVQLSDLKGKVVLINFWATWCAPCRAEMPELIKWQKQYQNKGLQIVGITYPPYKTIRVARLTKSLKTNYPIVFASKKLAGLYAVGEILPVTIIVDRQGMIVDRILGILEPEEFEQKVKPLLE